MARLGLLTAVPATLRPMAGVLRSSTPAPATFLVPLLIRSGWGGRGRILLRVLEVNVLYGVATTDCEGSQRDADVRRLSARSGIVSRRARARNRRRRRERADLRGLGPPTGNMPRLCSRRSP